VDFGGRAAGGNRPSLIGFQGLKRPRNDMPEAAAQLTGRFEKK